MGLLEKVVSCNEDHQDEPIVLKTEVSIFQVEKRNSLPES
jgi:hypothetical protein